MGAAGRARRACAVVASQAVASAVPVAGEGESEQIAGSRLVVEDERPVGEEQGGVGRVGRMRGGAPGLRLQLVAQIADIAEVEVERQARRRRDRAGAQLVVQVVEELLPNPLGGPVDPPDDDLAVSDAVGDMLGERTVSVPHDREARQPVDH